MNKKIYIMGFLIIVTVLNGCFKKESKVPISQRKIKVVATTGMIADAVKVIGKNRVAVNALMGPGIDPHLYQASAGDVTSLAAADIIFYHGLHLEAKMGDILKKMAKRHKTLAVADQLPADKLLKSSDYEELYDPHIWFNVELWQAAVQVVRDALIELDPESRNYYYRNTARYLSELAQLHQTVHQQIKQIPEERRILITAHDAFNYFSDAYGIRVVGLQGVSLSDRAYQQALAYARERVQGIAPGRVERDTIIHHPEIIKFIEKSLDCRSIFLLFKGAKSRSNSLIVIKLQSLLK